MVGEVGKPGVPWARPGTPGKGASQGIFGAHNQGVFNDQILLSLFGAARRVALPAADVVAMRR